MDTTTIETRLALETRLRAEGWPDLRVRQEIAKTGPARHAGRVAATRAAALAAAGTAWSLADTLLWLDLAGIGGQRGYLGHTCGQGSTARMPWARALGSGRWQAADGLAYRAAATEARAALAEEFGLGAPTPEDVRGALALGPDVCPPAWPWAEAMRRCEAAHSPAEAERWAALAAETSAGVSTREAERWGFGSGVVVGVVVGR